MDAALHEQRHRPGLPAGLHGPHVHSAPHRVALTKIRAVLLDVEGTTTPVEFVHQTLFGYARARMPEFLERHGDDPGVRADIALLKAEHAGPWRDDVASVTAYVHELMDRDSKSTGLKSLQGKIWEEGYRAGALRGEVYPDVPGALARWKREGSDIAIFSSGSVQAQRSLFANSTVGDLTPFIRAHFDTTTGPKIGPESYERIAAALGRPPRDVLFISDVPAELDAARTAGMQTALCVRGRAPAPTTDHPIIHAFDAVRTGTEEV